MVHYIDDIDAFAIPFTKKWKAEREAKKEVLDNSDKGTIGKFIAQTPVGRILGTDLSKDIKEAKNMAGEQYKEEKKETKVIEKAEREAEKIAEKAAKEAAKIAKKQAKTDAEIPTLAKTEELQSPSSGGNNKIIIIAVVVIVVIAGIIFFITRKK